MDVANHLQSKTIGGKMNFLIFGDSWARGSGLENPEDAPYGVWCAWNLGLEPIKAAKNASSAEHMILQLESTNRHLFNPISEATALFTLTSPSRHQYWNEHLQSWEEIQINRQDPNSKAWYRHLSTPTMDKHRMQITILALQRMCEQLGIKDRYVFGLEPFECTYPGIDQSKIYKQGKTSLSQIIGILPEDAAVREYCHMTPNEYTISDKNFHPNGAGHKLIADTLIPWLRDMNV